MFEQLIRNLSPGQAPDLRIGGDTTDWTWWPVPGVAKPRGIRYSLDKNWVGVTAALAHALGARLILGINFELDSKTDAAAEAQALVNGIGPASIEALELGNEPELYGSFSWYKTRERPARHRPAHGLRLLELPPGLRADRPGAAATSRSPGPPPARRSGSPSSAGSCPPSRA